MAVKSIAFIGAIEPNEADIALGFIGDASIIGSGIVVLAFSSHSFILFEVIAYRFYLYQINAAKDNSTYF